MHLLSPATWRWDFPRLPEPIRLAWLGKPSHSYITRLTETDFALRLNVNSPTQIGTMEEIIEALCAMPIPEPYSPPKYAPQARGEDLLKSLGLEELL